MVERTVPTADDYLVFGGKLPYPLLEIINGQKIDI